VQYKAKTVQLSAASGGLYQGMLFRWDELDAHNDRFVRSAEVIVHGEPPVYVEHDYTLPPVGKIVQLSGREDGMYVYLKLSQEVGEKNYLSVGGFAYNWRPNEVGGMDITRFVVLEASLTSTPAQRNTPLLHLKNQIAMSQSEKPKWEQLAVRVLKLAAELGQSGAKYDELASLTSQLEEQLAALKQANAHVEEKQINTSLLQLKNQIAMSAAKPQLEQLAARVEELAAVAVQQAANHNESASQIAGLKEKLAALEQAIALLEEKTKSILDEALKSFYAQTNALVDVMTKTIQTISEMHKKERAYARGN